MKNILPRVLWDYLLGALVGAIMVAVSLAIAGLVIGTSQNRIAGLYGTFGMYGTLAESLLLVGMVVFLGVLLVVTLYEIALFYRVRGRMFEEGNEWRVLTRESLFRALISGGVAGLYTALVVLVFASLAEGAFQLDLRWVFGLGLLPAVMLLAAGALAYTFSGTELKDRQSELVVWERVLLLTLPLILSALLGLLFGAAAGGVEGIVNALLAVLIASGLIHRLTRLRWRVLQRFLTGLLNARGGPTIKVVSHHRA